MMARRRLNTALRLTQHQFNRHRVWHHGQASWRGDPATGETIRAECGIAQGRNEQDKYIKEWLDFYVEGDGTEIRIAALFNDGGYSHSHRGIVEPGDQIR